MAQNDGSPAHNGMSTDQAMAAFLLTVAIDVVIESTLLAFGSWSPPTASSLFSAFFVPTFGSLVMLCTAAILAYGGYFQFRWKLWANDSTAFQSSVWNEWPVWRRAKYLATGLLVAAVIATFMITMLGAGLGGAPPSIDDFLPYYLTLAPYVASAFAVCVLTGTVGLYVADLLLVACPGPLPHAGRHELREAPRPLRRYIIYVLIWFGVMIAFPRTALALAGPAPTFFDIAVVAIAVLIFAWAWIKARRVG